MARRLVKTSRRGKRLLRRQPSRTATRCPPDSEEKRRRRLVHVPMGRFGEASEMARAALYLASNESSYLTGATFTVDGGITAAYVTPE